MLCKSQIKGPYWVPQKSVFGRLRDLQYRFAVIYETLCTWENWFLQGKVLNKVRRREKWAKLIIDWIIGQAVNVFSRFTRFFFDPTLDEQTRPCDKSFGSGWVLSGSRYDLRYLYCNFNIIIFVNKSTKNFNFR